MAWTDIFATALTMCQVTHIKRCGSHDQTPATETFQTFTSIRCWCKVITSTPSHSIGLIIWSHRAVIEDDNNM